MSATYYNNALTTQNILADEKKIDVSSDVAMLAPRLSPFLLLSNAPQVNYGGEQQNVPSVTFGTREVTNFEYDWFEDEIKSKTTAVNNSGGYGTGDTVLIVDDAQIFLPGDLVDAPATGEIVRVDDRDTTANTITVTRSFGTTAAAALADNAVLLIIGNVNAENSRSRQYTNTQKVKKTNYIATSRHTVEVTRHMQLTETYTQPDPRTYERAKVLKEHLIDCERSLMFSELHKGTEYGGSNVEYATKGLLSYAGESPYVTTGVGTLTKATFNSWLSDLFTYGENPERIIFASSTAAQAISNFAGDNTSNPKSSIYVDNLAKEFGIMVTTYHTLKGMVHIIIHPNFADSIYTGYMVGFDPANIRMTTIRGGNRFALFEDLQEKDQDGYKDEYRTDHGLEVKLTKTMALMTGITG